MAKRMRRKIIGFKVQNTSTGTLLGGILQDGTNTNKQLTNQ